jgi:hypothetical protein
VWYSYKPTQRKKKPVEPACRCRAPVAQLSLSELPWDSCRSRLFSFSHLGDLVHVGIVVDSRGGLGSRVGSWGGTISLVAAEVILHLSIKLFSSLRLGLSSTTSLLLVGTRLGGTGSTIGGALGALCGGTLGLLLGGGLGLAVKRVRHLSSCGAHVAGHLRNTVAEALRDCSSRNTLSSDNNLNLYMVSDEHTHHMIQNTYLHRTVVDLDTVQLTRGLGSTS